MIIYRYSFGNGYGEYIVGIAMAVSEDVAREAVCEKYKYCNDFDKNRLSLETICFDENGVMEVHFG